ncbi:MAG: phospho-N-acetylmuramoyl-pentapeptide-transferase [Spirochaetia bacterium]|nr:phospho-N-acetylmuramoyl-pentapeptide-transferase [Spirochaetia bacterium]
MLYWLLFPLKAQIPAFRIFGYVTFRAVMATLTAMILAFFLGPKFIEFLKRLNLGEKIRHDGPKSHHTKAGTPTMGGLLIVSSMSISVFLWGNLGNLNIWFIWIATLCFSLLGFIDDYSKSVKKISNGMSARVKFFWQFVISASFAILVYSFPKSNPHSTQLYLPFLKDPVFDMGIMAIFLWVFLINGFSNAVNLTDGLDGLAAGLSLIVMTTIGIISYLTGVGEIAKYLLIPFIPESNELTIFLGSLIGAGIGFLWYNSHPAQVFMGDTGSLALGGAIGMSAILIKREIILLILGGIFVAEVVSVILQVASFKLRKKRIFKMAPLHHHFELLGWHENKVVVRFWIIGILLALISLSSLKIL